MKFCWSTLYVKDLDKSIQFYEEIIGLPLVRRFNAGEQTEIAFLGSGETQIELIHDTTRPGGNTGTDISWGFAVDSLEQTFESMKDKDIKFLSDIIQPNPHSRFFFIEDPNGFKVQIAEI
ncbi:VOC family protein [Clostridium sp. C105KSO13]|uniref:VOC family protein n=1 Tax=Clostridium sp. C105KSO13 TaxID=1776045 RepID=UPI0007408586|nr:VOC family protein [Clostridium sp. C105KSO13]CUX40380.1 glyoxalase I [Clostridium sp. C105KSO13]